MPHYDFKCPECKLVIEKKIPWTDQPKIICHCGAEMDKLICDSPIRFQKIGLHKTDYKGK